jgi:HK97 family phage portal protein
MAKHFFARIGDTFHALAGKNYASPDIQSFLGGSDVEENAKGTKLVNPYAQAAWVYVAVSIIAQEVAKIPFRISKVSGNNARRVRALRGSADPAHRKFIKRALNGDILESGDVVDLFNRPHPSMDRQLFWEMVVTWFALRGEFFVMPMDSADQPVDLSDRNPRIQRLIALAPELFWHMVTGYDLTGWRYTGSPLLTPVPSQMLLPSEVIHSRTPNPYLYWRGMSPLIVASVAAHTDYAGEQFLKGLWVNNADTGVIVTTEQTLTEDQRKEMVAALNERKRKAGTADRPLFLFGGATVNKPTLTMMDMEFIKTRGFLMDEIFSIFKVPKSLAGFTADLNDGGAGGSLDAAKVSFIESTIGSLCSRLEAAFDPVVKSFDEGYVGWFDIDSLPIMQAARRTRWDTGTKMFAMGVPVADINVSLDLGLPDRPWYKKGFLPFNLQDAAQAGAEQLPSESDPNEPEPDDDPDDATKSNPFLRMQKLLAGIKHPAEPLIRKPSIDVVNLWKKHIAARKAQVNLFKGKVGKVLNVYRGKVLAKLDEVHLEKDAGRLQLPATARGLIDIIFNQHAFGDSLNNELQSPMQALLQSAGSELMDEIGNDDPWKYPPKGVLEYLAGRKQKIMGIGGTVRDQLNTSLEEGVTEGETHLQLAARVKSVFNHLTDAEAKRVAMTEVNIGYNTARHQAMDDAGIEYKSWLSSHGPHVRPAHAEAEEAYIDDPIPLDEPFEVMGEQLMFPGDDSLGASLENIINCQCIQLAAQKTGEDEKSITFKIFGVGTMKFLKKGDHNE